MISDPVAVVWSMINRKWGESLNKLSQRNYSIEECIRIWKMNIDLIQKYSSYKNTQICVFEKLIADATAESNRIFSFLSIFDSKPFRPKPTKTSEFSQTDREFILREKKSHREAILTLT